MSTNNPMTQEQLDAIRGRVDDTTRGPWDCYGNGAHEVFDAGEYDDGDPGELVAPMVNKLSDAVFIAYARTDVPALLAEVDRLRARPTVTDDMVERAEKAHRETFMTWPVKRNLKDSEDRRVAALRAALRAALDAALNPGEGS